MSEKTKFTVRDFGNDRGYGTVDDLMRGLEKHYAGRSVAIHVMTPKYGMTRPLFVDVSSDGELFETYGKNGRTRVEPTFIRDLAGHAA